VRSGPDRSLSKYGKSNNVKEPDNWSCSEMISTSTARGLTPWVVGLFFLAQIFAVVHLISEHTTHIAQSELGISLDRISTGNIPQGHHRGDADGFVQHHELQDLNGALTWTVSECGIGFVHAAVCPYTPDALSEGDAIFLERPPRALLSA
jgi:hypothetical protein